MAETAPTEKLSHFSNAFRMLEALQYPQFRRFWFGNLAAVAGQQMMWVAQAWLVYDLTGSPLYLGYAGLATAAPAILLNLVGGVLADRQDQRRVIFLTQLLSAAAAGALAILAGLGVAEPWHVLVAAFLSGSAQAFSNPARQAILPQLVKRESMTNAIALTSVLWQGTRIIVPAAAGIIVAVTSEALAIGICAIAFLPLGFTALSLDIAQVRGDRQASMMTDLVQGLSYIRQNSLFAFLIGMSFLSSFFGNSAQQLMPVFARDVLHIGSAGMGTLLSAAGVGAILGLTIVGSLRKTDGQGILLVGGSMAFGASVILFAISAWYPLSLFALFLTGAFGSIYMITVQTTLQMRVPDELRGRVMGIYGMTYNMGPLGGLQAGAVASAFSAPVAVAIGGFAIIAFAGSSLLRRDLRQLKSPPPITVSVG